MIEQNSKKVTSVFRLFENLFLLLVSFTLTSGILLNYLNAADNAELSTTISYYSLMITTFFALFLVVFNKRNWKPIIIILIIFAFLAYYQKKVDANGTVDDFINGFIIHGLGGFIMGYAIRKYRKFVSFISFFSFIYVMFFLFEPINHNLLKLSAMETGYLMSGLVVNLIMVSFIYSKKYIVIPVLALVSSFIVVLFTSRGCGISIAIAWIFFYVWHKKRQGYNVGGTIFKLAFLLILVFAVLDISVDYIFHSNIVLSKGSLLEKIVNGYVDTANGRDDIWELGLAMIKESWLTGMGLGADRTIEEHFFVHNIFLELMIDFGIPLTIIILCVYWTVVIKGIRSMLFSFSTALIMAQVFKTWVQLLFSSSYLNTMLGLMFIVGISVRAIIENKRYSRFIVK